MLFKTAFRNPVTGRGRFQMGRGLTFLYFEWLNSLKLLQKKY